MVTYLVETSAKSTHFSHLALGCTGGKPVGHACGKQQQQQQQQQQQEQTRKIRPQQKEQQQANQLPGALSGVLQAAVEDLVQQGLLPMVTFLCIIPLPRLNDSFAPKCTGYSCLDVEAPQPAIQWQSY